MAIAHRAGNDTAGLRAALDAGVDLVEADIHLFKGALEVRHLKTLGPVPVLWDRWRLAPPWAPRLVLDELLEAAAPSTCLMLDLKGRDPELAARVAAALREHARPRTVCCSRNWALLQAMGDIEGVDLVHSVGSGRQLAALRKLVASGSVAGVAIHKRLLNRRSLAELRRHVTMVLTWPVIDTHEADRLVGWGVDGLITQEYEAVAIGLGLTAQGAG